VKNKNTIKVMVPADLSANVGWPVGFIMAAKKDVPEDERRTAGEDDSRGEEGFRRLLQDIAALMPEPR
jgi:hypothetical protein